jgi:Zn-dependent peptidase ImmA (M78 family)/transcriptional regulator with XRE-family HTH domain
MTKETVKGIQPEIFRWARLTVGLSVADVAALLKRPTEEIEAWESGDDAPTYPQLEKLAYQVYKRPLAMFFLPSPPEESTPEHEFRTLPQADLKSLHRDTYLQIRRAHAYQIALKEVFGDSPTSQKSIWESINLTPSRSVAEQAQLIRDYFQISIQEQTSWKSDEAALKYWRKSIEAAGGFVFKAPFKQADISGFCLIDRAHPIIYLNNSTTKTRQIFSLMHELAHILLGVNGISKFDTSYIERLPNAERQLEQFCNQLAAEVLIPSADLAQQIKSLPQDVEQTSEEQFAMLANRYGVSREAVLRRLLDQTLVSQAFYEKKAKFWASQKKAGSGGNWYSNQGAYLSDRFTKEVVSKHYKHQITLEQAADYLGIKPKSFAGFEERVLQGASL